MTTYYCLRTNIKFRPPIIMPKKYPAIIAAVPDASKFATSFIPKYVLRFTENLYICFKCQSSVNKKFNRKFTRIFSCNFFQQFLIDSQRLYLNLIDNYLILPFISPFYHHNTTLLFFQTFINFDFSTLFNIIIKILGTI